MGRSKGSLKWTNAPGRAVCFRCGTKEISFRATRINGKDFCGKCVAIVNREKLMKQAEKVSEQKESGV